MTEQEHADKRAGHDHENATERTAAVAALVGLGVVGDPEHPAEQKGYGAGKKGGCEADENQVEHSVVLLKLLREDMTPPQIVAAREDQRFAYAGEISMREPVGGLPNSCTAEPPRLKSSQKGLS